MILHTFRGEIAPLFPFVVILPSMTFTDLREKKPFLALAILMVGYRHDHVRQTAIAKSMRDIISYKLLIKGERNLDILQSLLVYVDWSVCQLGISWFRPLTDSQNRYHLHQHLGSQLSNLVHLVMAMMTDLGLNKKILAKNLTSTFDNSGCSGRAGSAPSAMPATNRAVPNSSIIRTLEERRTFLGCFFLTSM